MELIKPELLVLVPVLYIIGLVLKKFNRIDRFIPLILGGISVVLAGIYLLTIQSFGASLLFAALTQGILCAGLSVYANQVYKQLKKSESDNDTTK